jgi:hypothetical protein
LPAVVPAAPPLTGVAPYPPALVVLPPEPVVAPPEPLVVPPVFAPKPAAPEPAAPPAEKSTGAASLEHATQSRTPNEPTNFVMMIVSRQAREWRAQAALRFYCPPHGQ